MDRCPICNASYGGKESCHRCKSNLKIFTAIEAEADALLLMAVTAFKQRDYSNALGLARKSCGLKFSKPGKMLWDYSASLETVSFQKK